MRWQHAMMPVADQPDVLPGLALSAPDERPGARAEYVDRSDVAPSIVTPEGMNTRRSWRSRLRRLAAAVVVLLAIAGTVVVARMVLVRLLADDDTVLADTSTDQQVGPLVVAVPDGLDRSDCSDPPLVSTCVQWSDTGDDAVFVVQVADLGSRIDESGLRSVLPRIAERLDASLTVAIGGPTVSVGGSRMTITAETSVNGVEGRVTVVVIGRWAMTVLTSGPEGYLDWHDAVVASVRRA
jgi:hypothetical protein